MTRIHRYTIAAIVGAAVLAPAAPAQTLPIDPGKPTAAEKRQVLKKKKQPARKHVAPVRKKPPLEP